MFIGARGATLTPLHVGKSVTNPINCINNNKVGGKNQL